MKWLRSFCIRLTCVLCAGILALSGSVAAAQAPSEPATDDRTDVGDIIVSATRSERRVQDVPAAVQVLGGGEIRRRTDGVRLDQSLSLVPGVQARNRFLGDDSRFLIRGQGARASFGVRGVQILMDGVPLTGPDGQSRLEPIDPLGLERVEIMRGPASSVWGGGSIGGVMNFVTRRPTATPEREIFLNFGQYGIDQQGFRASGIMPSGIGYSALFDRTDIGGYRRHSNWQAMKLNSNLYLPLDLADDEELRLFVQLTSVNIDQPGSLTEAQMKADPRQAQAQSVTRGAGRFDDRGRFGGTYQTKVRDNAKLDVSAFVTARQIEHPLNFAFLDINSNGYFASTKYAQPFHTGRAHHEFLAGADYQLEYNDQVQRQYQGAGRDTEQSNTRVQSTAFGALAQDEIRFSEDWSATLGLRWDLLRYYQEDRFIQNGKADVTADFSEFSPRIGVLRRVSASRSVYANYSEAFEPPTSSEIQNTDGANNGALRPQEASNYEVGLRGASEMFNRPARYDIAVYRMKSRDFIVSRTVNFQTIYRNAARTRQQGVEVGCGVPLTARLELNGAYAWQDHRFTSFDTHAHRRIPGVPDHFASAELMWKAPPEGLTLRAQWHWVNTSFLDDANTQRRDAYHTLDFGGEYVRGNASWTLTLENLTDELYSADVTVNDGSNAYYSPSPDRNVRGGVTWKF